MFLFHYVILNNNGTGGWVTICCYKQIYDVKNVFFVPSNTFDQIWNSLNDVKCILCWVHTLKKELIQ